MAKRTKKLLTLCLALIFCVSIIATPASAFGWGGWGQDYSDHYEWYEVYVQGNLVASGRGEGGDMYYLGTHYSADITADGPIISWYIITHGGYGNAWDDVVDLRNYITVPDGYTVKDYSITNSSVEGINNPSGSDYFDNAILSITIETLYNEITKEEIEVKDEERVTVNHLYYTYDAYLDETVLDGSTSDSELAVVGESYTASPVTTYGGNEYEMTGASPDLTITVQEDASANVINIEYLRSIDTTPKPVETSVTVNHTYYTYDAYLDETVLDGTTSGSEAVIEGQSYTASPVTTYGGNAYAVNSVIPGETIYIDADAAQNVISFTYLRSIDTTPDPSVSDPSVPDPSVPDPSVPDPSVPDPSVPDPSVPDPSVPDPSVPDPSVPDPSVPDPSVPDPSVPDPSVPDPSVPDPSVPDPSVPDPSVPDPSVPDPSVPDPSVPDPSVPDPSIPEPTIPDEPVVPVVISDDEEIPDDPDIPDEPVVPVVISEDEDLPDDPEIPDEEVPLADVPETGDISLLWAAMSVMSAGGIVAVNRKKTKKEENE